jgi:hypothetical protein
VHRADLVDHLPGSREDPLGSDGLPELEVEGAIVLLAAAQDAASGDSSVPHGRKV